MPKSKMADDEAEVLDNWEEQADSGVSIHFQN